MSQKLSVRQQPTLPQLLAWGMDIGVWKPRPHQPHQPGASCLANLRPPGQGELALEHGELVHQRDGGGMDGMGR